MRGKVRPTKAWSAVERLRSAGIPVTVIATLSRANLGELPALRGQLLARGPGLLWQIQVANGTGERFAKSQMLEPRHLLDVARFIEQTRAAIPRARLAVAGGHNIG